MTAPVPILYEDNHVLAILKPPGLLSQADRTGDPDVLSVLKDYIRQRDAKPGNVWLGLVHRLDRPTGGVMILAKTSKAAARLSASIRAHRMTKYYLVRHTGRLPESPGMAHRWTDRLVKDPATVTSRVTDRDTPEARTAELAVTPLSDGLATCRLITGRSHQIRVQFAARGCPLMGDRKYGPDGGRTRELGLFAYRVDVPHPTRDLTLTVAAEPSGPLWTPFAAVTARLLAECPTSPELPREAPSPQA